MVDGNSTSAGTQCVNTILPQPAKECSLGIYRLRIDNGKLLQHNVCV